jgi:hypothetical protein
MWKSRAVGLLIAAVGGAVLGFLVSQVTDQSDEYLFVYRIGIPGVLLLTAPAILAVVFGLHLLFAPRSAIRRWTPKLPRRS